MKPAHADMPLRFLVGSFAESMTEVSSGHLLRPSVVPCGGGHRHRRFIGSPAVVEVGYPLADWLA